MTHEQRRERRKRIADAVRAGKTSDEIARQFGTGRETLRRACEENDVPVPCEAPREPHPSGYRIIAALFGDETYTEIAARFGVSEQRVGQIAKKCRDAGVPLPERSIGRRPARQ